MSPGDLAPSQRHEARHSAELMIAPDAAWQMIVDAKMIAAWYSFGGATIEPRVGGRFELCWDPGTVFRGRITAIEEPHTLTYRLPQEPGIELTASNSTQVTLTVSESAKNPGRAVVTVLENGFESLDAKYSPSDAYRASQMAWIGALGLLVQSTGVPPQI